MAEALYRALGRRGFRLLLPELLPLLLGDLKSERDSVQSGADRPRSLAVMRFLAAVKVRSIAR